MSDDGLREDTWLTDAQLAKCARADTELFPSPIPTQLVSNGEWMPMPQTKEQQRIEARTNELADTAARKLGMSRRKFMTTTGGMAATFLAMNEIFGRYFNISRDALFESEAFAADGPPKDLFIFDDQLHMIRQSHLTENRALRALAQGITSPHAEFPTNPFNPQLEDPPLPHPVVDELALRGDIDVSGGYWRNWNPALVGDPMGPDIYHLVSFIESLYLQSQMTVGLLSNISGFLPVFVSGPEPKNVNDARKIEVLTPDQCVGVRDFVNKLAGGPQRLYTHGILYPGTANLFEHERPGFGNICVHKGFAPPPHDQAHDNPENGNPEDLPKVARDWPTFNFIIYHSCIRPVLFYNPDPLQNLLKRNPTLQDGDPKVEWTTRFAQLSRNLHNVYAEVGSTFASTIITFPTVWAHIIGQLMKHMGSRRICFGSDSLWYGAPQWQYEAFWRFQMPEVLHKKWGYPEITEADKRNILGLNSARLYHVGETSSNKYSNVPKNFERQIPDDLKALLEFPGFARGGDGDVRKAFASDNISKMKARYLEQARVPDHRRHGWIRKQV